MNKPRFFRACLAIFAGLLAATPVAAESSLARVVGIYVELAPGLLSERTGRSAEAGLPLCAEVRIPSKDGSTARLAIVRLNGVAAGLGDVVEVNLGERGSALLTGPRPAQPRVVRIETRADSMFAQSAGAP